MGRKFIPAGDSEFAAMARGFANAIAKNPQRFLVAREESDELSQLVQAFRDKLAVATTRDGRTPSAITAKQCARKNAEAVVRRIGRLVRASDKVSAADKTSLTIRERPQRLRKRTCPLAPPTLTYAGAPHRAGPNSGLHLLHVAEGFQFALRSKPNGAVRVELFCDLVMPGEPVPRFPGEFLGGRPWYLRSFTSSPIKVQHPAPPVPMLVVYWARWADAKGEVGPFSQTCVARVEGGWGNAWGKGDKLLGAVPDVTTLANDPKYLTTITQFRERLLQEVTVERMLTDEPCAQTETPTPKQLPPMTEAA